MDKSWAGIISDLQGRGMTYAQIGEAIGCAGSTVGDIASGRSQSPRASSAIALLRLYQARSSVQEGRAIARIGALVDRCMSKRALRTKFGFRTDAHLAVVLGVSAEVIDAWPEGENVPAELVGAVQKLLGHEAQPTQQGGAQDPDEQRIVTLEVA